MTKRAIALLALAMILAGCSSGYSEPDRVGARATEQALSLEATRTTLDLAERELDLAWKAARQDALDPFLMTLPWVVLVAGLVSFLYVGYRLLQVVEARWRVVHRRPEDGEPLMMVGRDRVALPLRIANFYADLKRGAERSPMLAPSVEAQERATMRQQTANLALAGQAAQTVEARTRQVQNIVMLPESKDKGTPSLPAPSPVRVVEPSEVSRWVSDVEQVLLPEVVSDD